MPFMALWVAPLAQGRFQVGVPRSFELQELS